MSSSFALFVLLLVAIVSYSTTFGQDCGPDQQLAQVCLPNCDSQSSCPGSSLSNQAICINVCITINVNVLTGAGGTCYVPQCTSAPNNNFNQSNNNNQNNNVNINDNINNNVNQNTNGNQNNNVNINSNINNNVNQNTKNNHCCQQCLPLQAGQNPRAATWSLTCPNTICRTFCPNNNVNINSNINNNVNG